MKTIVIPAADTTTKYDGETVTTDHVLHLTYRSILGSMTWKRFGIGGVPRGREGRKVHAGPMVPGPWAYAFGLGVVLTANRNLGTGAESERLRAAGKEHDVEDGDHLVFDGVTYRIDVVGSFGSKRSGPLEFIELVPVDEPITRQPVTSEQETPMKTTKKSDTKKAAKPSVVKTAVEMLADAVRRPVGTPNLTEAATAKQDKKLAEKAARNAKVDAALNARSSAPATSSPAPAPAPAPVARHSREPRPATTPAVASTAAAKGEAPAKASAPVSAKAKPVKGPHAVCSKCGRDNHRPAETADCRVKAACDARRKKNAELAKAAAKPAAPVKGASKASASA